jgi:hypothetical protein
VNTGYAILKQTGTGSNKSWQLVQYDHSGRLLTDKEITGFKS